MRILPSSGASRIEGHKRKLVIELVRGSGGFFEGVANTRKRWDVNAAVQVPPTLYTPTAIHWPPQAPPRVEDPDEEGWKRWHAYSDAWCEEVDGLYENHVPEEARLLNAYTSINVLWRPFLSACVVYEPPDTQLEEYAGCHDFGPSGYIDPAEPFANHSENTMHQPPIRDMGDADDAERAWSNAAWAFADYMLSEHQKEPEREITDIVVESIRSGKFEPSREYHDANPRKPFIEVRPWHTEKDVLSAFRMIRDAQGGQNRGGAPTRDPLIAVQCAILYDEYGSPDPSDRRRRQWTYQKLAKRFGLSSWRAAKSHVELGREIRAQ